MVARFCFLAKIAKAVFMVCVVPAIFPVNGKEAYACMGGKWTNDVKLSRGKLKSHTFMERPNQKLVAPLHSLNKSFKTRSHIKIYFSDFF